MSDAKIQDQVAALQQQLGAVTKKLAELSSENVALKKTVGEQVTILAPGDAPVYELSGPYFSPDDVYYPEGVQFEDITGTITPNDVMIPMNAAAEKRVRDWMARQPSKTRTPPLELIVQASMELRPKEGEDSRSLIDQQTLVLRRALELHHERMGISPAQSERGSVLPRRADPNVPLMSNTRINGSAGQRHQQATRLREAAVAPADKSVPPMGTRSSAIGAHATPGVTASR